MVELNLQLLTGIDLETKIEGIILSKLPYKERHLICNLLLRSGKKISVIFYGGRGGGKKHKSTVLELGRMLRVELKQSSKQRDLYSAKEWTLLWSHERIRSNHNAFYLMCFYLELLSKISQVEIMDGHSKSFESCQEGNFRVLSNALVFLEDSLKDNLFQKEAALSIFMGKLLLEHGIFPHLSTCCLSDEALTDHSDVALLPEEGGFAFSSLAQGDIARYYRSDNLGQELWKLLSFVKTKKTANN